MSKKISPKYGYINFKLRGNGDFLLKSFIVENGDNTFTLNIDSSVPMSKHYEDLLIRILTGKYTLHYVDKDGSSQILSFDYGCPITNVKEYIKVFDGLPVEFIFDDNFKLDEAVLFSDISSSIISA